MFELSERVRETIQEKVYENLVASRLRLHLVTGWHESPGTG